MSTTTNLDDAGVAVANIEALLAAILDNTEKFSTSHLDRHERVALEHIVRACTMMEQQIDALRVALWGEERSP